MKKKHRFSTIIHFHYLKLFCRTILFAAAVIAFFTGGISPDFSSRPVLTWSIWLFFMLEILLRFFPSRFESMGCQKVFRKNYRPTGTSEKPKVSSGLATAAVLAAWVGLNGSFYLLYRFGLIGSDILLLISLAYSICDIICILFFCPFQTWFMKNRCCTTCRIYNWDFAMMFTPMLFVNTLFARSLSLVSLALLMKWELIFRLKTERFAENTNESLACRNCQEKLCRHKKQILQFVKR